MNTIERDKQRKYQRDWYYKNKETRLAETKANRFKIRKWVSDLKKTLSCSCGEDHPSCLEFHHKDPTQKDLSIADAISNGWSISRMIKEIEKCEVLCANCHRKVHNP